MGICCFFCFTKFILAYGAWGHAPRRRRFGQRLLKKDLKIIEEFLMGLGFEMELFPAKGAFEIEGFVNGASEISMLPEQAQAMFIYTPSKAKLCLREGCTQYEFFHELMHVRQAKDIGLAKYYKLGGVETSGELAKEMHVFEKVLQNKNLFTRNELKHAEWNINETRRTFGEAPISYDFDLSTIPIIRKEIGIENIIKIK